MTILTPRSSDVVEAEIAAGCVVLGKGLVLLKQAAVFVEAGLSDREMEERITKISSGIDLIKVNLEELDRELVSALDQENAAMRAFYGESLEEVLEMTGGDFLRAVQVRESISGRLGWTEENDQTNLQ